MAYLCDCGAADCKICHPENFDHCGRHGKHYFTEYGCPTCERAIDNIAFDNY